MSASAMGCSLRKRASSASAGGQLEQPSDVKSSTSIGVLAGGSIGAAPSVRLTSSVTRTKNTHPPGQWAVPGATGRAISMSIVIVTSSPTTGPASTIELYLKPYSSRLIFVVAVVPVTTPFMPLVTGAGASTSSTTSLVTLRIV